MSHANPAKCQLCKQPEGAHPLEHPYPHRFVDVGVEGLPVALFWGGVSSVAIAALFVGAAVASGDVVLLVPGVAGGGGVLICAIDTRRIQRRLFHPDSHVVSEAVADRKPGRAT